MAKFNAYCRLLRLHQSAGIWLLLWPCWWAIALASPGLPSILLLALFGIGAIVMRGAGCIVNDIADRDIDRQVERTRLRPLASGEIPLMHAVLLLFALLLIAWGIALQMNRLVFLLAACSLILVASYPFMKRITWWPQAFLGLTFNWGALMGWAAVEGRISLPAIILYVAGMFWTLGYDTIYAHQDKADDIKIGVKSTALRLGADSKRWIAGFYVCTIAGLLIAGAFTHAHTVYYIGIACAAIHCAWQIMRAQLDDAASCMAIFRSNITLGWIVFAGILVDKIF